MGRSFAYLGIPPLFIGEIVLGAFLLLKPRVVLGTWADCPTAAIAAQRARPCPAAVHGLRHLAGRARGARWQRRSLHAQVLHLQLLYTISVSGDVVGSPRARFLSQTDPCCSLGKRNLRRALPRGAQVRGRLSMPGYDVPLFSAAGRPGGGDPRIAVLRARSPVGLVRPGAQYRRSRWCGRCAPSGLGLALGILAWGLLTGRLGRVVAIGMAGLAVLGSIEFADIRLPGRNGDSVSLSETWRASLPRSISSLPSN